MIFISENLKRYRLPKDLTQEDIANYLGITPQSVSKWERGESYPDITFLPALSNILGVSIDDLIGMDAIRSEEMRHSIHAKAHDYMRKGDYFGAEKVYRDALVTYPNNAGMVLGLADALTLYGKTEEAIEIIEEGLPLCESEKHKATARAVLCFLYLKCGETEKAISLAATLPHTIESREVIQPLILRGLNENEINSKMRQLIVGS